MALNDSTKTATVLHGWHHDDYDLAKRQIMQALGSSEDLEIFGSNVLVAVYVRPDRTARGFYMGSKKQIEDIYNGKAVMIIKCGPDAFKGDEGWTKAQYGERKPPEPGDWCFVREDMGVPIMFCGDGASRPKGEDRDGKAVDVYDWDGWPCRIIGHTDLIGRMNKPHTVV
jgi:hypothetical protein